jgi:hypothetical protein
MGCLGGMATSGMVPAWDGMADGEKPLVGGFMLDLVDTLHRRGWLPPYVEPDRWRRKLLCPTPFHPEPVKRLLDEWAREAGVEVRFFTRVVDVDVDQDQPAIRGVILHQAEGLRYVPARTVIDATGIAAVAVQAGAAHRRAGRDTEHIMPASLCSLVAGVDPWNAGRKTDERIARAQAEGHFSSADTHSLATPLGRSLVGFNAGHLFETDACNTSGVTEAMIAGRKLAVENVEFYRKYVPGWEQAELAATASLLGVREAVQILGEYELTKNDYLDRRHVPDQIGLFNKEMDIHQYSADPEELARHRASRQARENFYQPGESYGIPYGVIVPAGWANLWVPGRAASCDVAAHGSLRVMPAAAMMGQAAGTAAEQAVRTGQRADRLDVAELVATLRAHGAILPEDQTPTRITRSGARA